jgi:ethanolamine utilization protein EutN
VYLGRVIGRVVATRRTTGLSGEKLMIVQPVDEKGGHAGDTVVACDVVDSGLGDLVHVCDGRESSMALSEPFVPVDATIVGHVEEFETLPASERPPARPAPRPTPSHRGRGTLR